MTATAPDWAALARSVEFPTDLMIDGRWTPGAGRAGRPFLARMGPIGPHGKGENSETGSRDRSDLGGDLVPSVPGGVARVAAAEQHAAFGITPDDLPVPEHTTSAPGNWTDAVSEFG